MTQEEVIIKIKNILKDLDEALSTYEGGGIKYVDYQDNIVFVNLIGSCAECMFRDETLENMILVQLQEEVPEIKGVINVPV